jgi:AcrR family transcriptional regulator
MAREGVDPVESGKRERVTRERVLTVALDVADTDGIAGVTMRAVADRLGVEAMALYRHVADKDALLDGLVDVVVSEINDACGSLPAAPSASDWRAIVRRRILTARAVILRHRWAPQLISIRGTLGPGLLEYFDRLCGDMVAGGCSMDLVHRAMHALGSRALGFSPELFIPGSAAADNSDIAMEEMAAFADQYPNIIALASEMMSHDDETTVGWCDDQTEFEFGLDLILDGLEARRARRLAS